MLKTFTEDLYNFVLEHLDGSNEKFKRRRFLNAPSSEIIIGNLSDKDSAYSVEEDTQNIRDKKSTAAHNNMGVSFLIDKSKLNSNSSIVIKPSCSVFLKDIPTYDEQKDYLNWINNSNLEYLKENPDLSPIYLRREPKLKELKIVGDAILKNIKKPFDIKESVNTLTKETKKALLNYCQKEDKYNYENERRNKLITKNVNWSYCIIIESFEIEHNLIKITIWFINDTKKNRNNLRDNFLFNSKLLIKLNNLSLVPFKYRFYDHSRKEKNIYESEYCRGINTHTQYHNNENIIETIHYGIFQQKRLKPRTVYNKVDAPFSKLKNQPIEVLERILEQMNIILTEYKNKHHDYVMDFEETVNRFEAGINILKKNHNALFAFKLMQTVFKFASKYKFEQWRLFQIVFIVSLIPDLVNPQIDSPAEILHVNTGGGKSETYFGIIVFQLFYDRLNGKMGGVSAFVKFPLRMLSIQQLQRIATIIIIAEEVRKKNKIDGEKFSLGYFVGVSKEFPRNTYDEIKNLKTPKPGLILSKCPFCEDGVVKRYADAQIRRIVHKCDKCGRNFYLYYTNEEVYRYTPSVIVSTVDKLAAISSNRRFRNLLGGKMNKCPNNHGNLPYKEPCEVKIGRDRCNQIGSDDFFNFPPPSLMIQDEIHLLKEGFGTIDSHFESLIDNIVYHFSSKKRRLKYIAMSATIQGVEKQVYNLYGRNVKVFPPKAPIIGEKEDFFFEWESDHNLEYQRIIIGLKPNLRDNQYASLLTLRYIAEFIKKVQDNKKKYSQKYNITIKQLEDVLSFYRLVLTYHNKKSDLYGMEYYLDPFVNSNLEGIIIKSRTLSGDNSLIQIKNAIKNIEQFNEPNIDATFATSVVSHGIDIDHWNLMIFQGMTSNTAEYIQALSRVGRKKIGIIFIWYYPNRVRDLSFYRHFKLYHDMLEYKVEPSPISRFAELAIYQTITSIFSGAILNYFTNLFETQLHRVNDVNENFRNPINKTKLKKFIIESYRTDLELRGNTKVESIIEKEVDKRLSYLEEYSGSEIYFFPNALKDNDDIYFKMQYGMRGVQPEVTLSLDSDYDNFVKKYGGSDND
ncbi:MAG: helicase-related protein [Promethearchaeota archaeon]